MFGFENEYWETRENVQICIKFACARWRPVEANWSRKKNLRRRNTLVSNSRHTVPPPPYGCPEGIRTRLFITRCDGPQLWSTANANLVYWKVKKVHLEWGMNTLNPRYKCMPSSGVVYCWVLLVSLLNIGAMGETEQPYATPYNPMVVSYEEYEEAIQTFNKANTFHKRGSRVVQHLKFLCKFQHNS